MKTAAEIIGLGFASFLLVLICVPIIKKLAIQFNLVDKPNYRKVHAEPFPLIGGITIGFVFILCSFIFLNEKNMSNYITILSTSVILLIVGVIDDKNDLKAKYKLLIQLLLAFFVASSGTRISSFYGLFGIEEINIWLQYILTIIVITGVVNAFNLMDGVDGLVGCLSFLGFMLLFLAGLLYKDFILAKIAFIFMGAILGFLRFNLSKKKIFMGDAGSLFLGYILITLGIRFMEKQTINESQNYFYLFLIIVTFFTIPVLDSLRVYLGRIKNGVSPFKADKSHLHHLLLQVGLTHKKIAFSITFFAILLLVFGFSLISVATITLTVFAIMIAFILMIKGLLILNSLKKWQKVIKIMETN